MQLTEKQGGMLHWIVSCFMSTIFSEKNQLHISNGTITATLYSLKVDANYLNWRDFYQKHQYLTTNVTGRHHGPKQKLRVESAVTKTDVTYYDAFSSSIMVSRAFSALCVHSKFGHHPHPLCHLCAKFRFFRSFHC